MDINDTFLRGGQAEDSANGQSSTQSSTGSTRGERVRKGMQNAAEATKRGARAASKHAKEMAKKSSEGIRRSMMTLEDKMSDDAYSIRAFHTFLVVLVLTVVVFAVAAFFAKRNHCDKKLESAYTQYMRLVAYGALTGVILGGLAGASTIIFMRQSNQIEDLKGSKQL